MSQAWNVITAISTAATAVVAIATYSIVRWQWYLSKPTISHSNPGDSSKEYRNLKVSIDDPNRGKWFINEIRVVTPKEARIAEIVSNPTTNKPQPGSWLDKMVFSKCPGGVGILFTSAPGDTVKFEVFISPKSKPGKKIKYVIAEEMHEFKKP